MNSPDATKNLVGTGCPMNLVYTKVELSRLVTGQVLEIILDDGAPVTNLFRSVLNEGHQILNKEQLKDGSWSVRIRKG